MPDNNPQLGSSDGGPGGLVTNPPQAVPAADQRPDDQVLPRSIPGSDNGVKENWEERFKGLQRRYDTDRKAWEGERDALQGQVDSIMSKLSSLAEPQAPEAPAQAPKKAPVPEPTVTKSEAQTTADAIEQAIALKSAEKYRNSLLEEYTQPGQGFTEITPPGVSTQVFSGLLQVPERSERMGLFFC